MRASTTTPAPNQKPAICTKNCALRGEFTAQSASLGVNPRVHRPSDDRMEHRRVEVLPRDLERSAGSELL